MISPRLQAAFAVALFLPVALPAAPYLVKDLNPGPSDELQNVQAWGLVSGPDGVSYFSASDPAHGTELWRTDGTPAGTYRVTDICAGRCSSAPSPVRIFHGQIFFSADDGFSGSELWATDGTPGGEHRVRDLCAGPCSSSPFPLGEVGGSLLFFATNGRRLQLWKTDGTRDGTAPLKLLCTGDHQSTCVPYPSWWTSTGERAIFFHPESSELWVTDGTAAGTRPFRETFGGELDPQGNDLLLVPGPGFAWVWTGAGLWRTDGTAAGTHRLKALSELAHDPDGPYGLMYRAVVWHGLFFGVLGPGEVFRSDGTPEGTYRIAEISGFAGGDLVALDDQVLFTVVTETSGSLWSSRGTADTTVQVVDLESSTPALKIDFVSLGNRALFKQDLPPVLWITDGTAAGTRKLSLPEHPDYDLSGLAFTPAGRQAYFVRDNNNDYWKADDLWITDGSEAGTRRVKDFHVAPGSSGPLVQTAVGNRLLFSAQTDGVESAPLFLTDGTTAGTQILSTDASWASDFIRLGDRLLFSAAERTPDRYEYSKGVWRTDGTAAGTAQATPQYFDLHNAMAFGGSLFFSHRNEYGFNLELWKNDGTTRGMALVKDINPYLEPAPHHLCSNEGSFPQPVLVLRDRLLLTANDGKHGRELWTTDGTRQGTRLLLDLNPLRSPEPPPSCDDDRHPRTDTGLSSNPQGFVALGDIALFSAVDGRTGRELWRTDGTPQRTRRVVDLRPGPRGSVPHDLVVFHEQVFFFASSEGVGEALWRTDGTARGTELVRDLALDGVPSWGRDLTIIGDQLFFTVYNETTGAELWVSGGDTASTALVADLNPGPANGAPQKLTDAGGILVFAADDGLTGLEPWRSDGTPAGTFKLIDLAPGPDSSSPGPFTRVRQVLVAGADDGAHGREPWAFPLNDILPP